MNADVLPFDQSDLDMIEQDRTTAIIERAEKTRREICPGCADEIPVKRASQVADSEMYYLLHVGNKEWGSCWCQCPELHPENYKP